MLFFSRFCDIDQLRAAPARVCGFAAPCVERAGARHFLPERLRRLRDGLGGRRAETRHGRHQHLRVGMSGFLTDVLRCPHLHDMTAVHDRDAVAQIIDHIQIVGDEQHREVFFRVDFLEKVQNLGADRDVQRGDRFVRNNQLRLEHQRCADTHPLLLSAGQLTRIARGIGLVQADLLQHTADRRILLRPGADFMGAKGLPHRKTDGFARIQRAGRVLKDRLHGGAEGKPVQLRALPSHHPDRSLVGNQSENRVGQRRFAAAGLSHQPEELVLPDRETDVMQHLPLRLF